MTETTKSPQHLLVALLAALSAFAPAGCGTAQEDERKAPTSQQKAATDEKEQRPVQKGTTYYVSPKGDNANPGTKEKPWATPGFGSRRLKPGDTLIITEGKYLLAVSDDDIITPTGGTADGWVVIRGEEGKRPVLAGRDNLAHAVNLSGASCVWLENLEITHDAEAKGQAAHFRDGIVITEKPASHIVLKDLYIHHIDEMGLNAQDVDHLQLLNCRIEYTGFGSLGGPAGVRGGWRNVLIKGCRLSYNGHYYQGGNGDNRPYDRPDGFGIEPSEGPIEIAHTIAEHNRGDGLDSKAANTHIHHCIIANNSCDGVKVWGRNSRIENTLIYGTGDGKGGASPWAGLVIDQVEQPNASFEIVNVTIHDNPSREAYPVYAQYDSKVPITITMTNTIIANGHGVAFFGDSVKLIAQHNIFFRPGQEVQVRANGRDYTAAQLAELGKGNLSQDPMFVAPAWGKDGDYHTKPGSPAIDAGTSSGAPATDLDGKPRPRGKAPDIGAYEQ